MSAIQPMSITTNGWIRDIEWAIEAMPHSHDISEACRRCRAEFALRELIDLIVIMSEKP